jgi:hypothetical protein
MKVPTKALREIDLGLVFVQWLDSAALNGWTSGEEITPLRVYTVGWLVGEFDTHLVVTSSVGPGAEEEHLAPLAIPRGCIENWKHLVRGAVA